MGILRQIEIPPGVNARLEGSVLTVSGPKGTLVSFHNDEFPDPAGLLSYAQRLEGTIKLRPDSKIVVVRAWGSAEARLNGLFQLTKGLSAIARKAR